MCCLEIFVKLATNTRLTLYSYKERACSLALGSWYPLTRGKSAGSRNRGGRGNRGGSLSSESDCLPDESDDSKGSSEGGSVKSIIKKPLESYLGLLLSVESSLESET